jgi:pimeloyl-ACP methyl ester carboxylesterase
MDRRDFLTTGARALAIGAIIKHAPLLEGNPSEPTAAEFGASRRFVQTRFGRIAYVERGTGPAALFLHGFPLNGFQWRGALERLSRDRRCLLPDFLAMGYTEVAKGQRVGPDEQTAMIIEFLDALQIASVDLIANDSGGAIAQLLVAKHPERTRTLLLTNCDTEIDSPPPALLPVIELSKAGTWVDQWLVPWVKDKSLARSAQGLGGMTYTYPVNPTDDSVEYYLRPLTSSPERKALAHAYAIALERNALAGISTALKSSRVPTRIVWGTGDEIFSRESPAYLDRTFGQSRGIRLISGAKLFFPEEFPDVIAEEARQLWGVR